MFGNLFGKKAKPGSTPQEPIEIQNAIDRVGKAQIIFGLNQERFAQAVRDQDDEAKVACLTQLLDLTEEYPEFIKPHCVLARAALQMEEFDTALGFANDAYRVEPTAPEVTLTLASALAAKAANLLENGDKEGAYQYFFKALQANGYEIQCFLMSRSLAKELGILEKFAVECFELGIDPTQEVDPEQLMKHVRE